MVYVTDIDLSISSISSIKLDENIYRVDNEPLDYPIIKPYLKVIDYYNQFSEEKLSIQNLLLNEKILTLTDLYQIIHRDISIKLFSYDCLVVSNTFPDRQLGNPPISRLLENSNCKPRNYFAVTHLGSNAAIDCLDILDASLNPNEQGILLLGEQIFVLEQRFMEGFFPYGDAVTGLEVKKDIGPICINKIGTFNYKSTGNSIFDIDQIIQTVKKLVSQTFKPQKIIFQNIMEGIRLYNNKILYKRTYKSKIDYQNSDVWISLIELLKKGSLMKGDNILLIAINRDYNVSFAALKYNYKPKIVIHDIQERSHQGGEVH